MGTPDFAVPSLESLVQHGYEIPAVVTAPDRPRGRGREVLPSPVKRRATELGEREDAVSCPHKEETSLQEHFTRREVLKVSCHPGPVDLYDPPPMSRVGPRRGREGPYEIADRSSRLVPPYVAISLQDLGRRCSHRGILRNPWRVPLFNQADGLQNQRGTENGEPVVKGTRVIFLRNGNCLLENHGSRVNLFLQEEGRETRQLLPVHDGSLYGGRSTVPWQQ